ncbi:hypothetical protein ACFLTH_12570 [Bacteroidota bacterium]
MIKLKMNRKGMEMQTAVAIGLALLILIFTLMVITKSGSESGNVLEKIFSLLS